MNFLIFQVRIAQFSLVLVALLLLNFLLASLAKAATPTPNTTPKPANPTPAASSDKQSGPAITTTAITSAKSTPTFASLATPGKTALTTAPTTHLPATSAPAPTIIIKPPTATPNAPKLVSRPPTLSAVSAIAIDADTGKILYNKNAERSLAMASTTKIMTALTLLSIPGLDLNAETIVTEDDLVGEADMNLRAGERIHILTLLVGLLTNSANEAGMALARYGGSLLPGSASPVDRFVGQMNSKALSLNMFGSHYMNPHGLDQPGHYSSARDLAISGWYALKNPTLASIVRLDTYAVENHDFFNLNNFIRRYPGATGIKPGLTDDAGHCLVASASNYGHKVIAVVMNDDNMATDIDTLMDYSFSLLTKRAEPQQILSGAAAYIGLPQKDYLLPFDTAPVIEFLRWLASSIGQWLNALKTTPN